MKNEQQMEKIFDLLEQYNFQELSQDDRLKVLAEMSEEEYNDMRSTIGASKSYFEKENSILLEKEQTTKTVSLISLFKYAAVAVLFISLGFIGGKFSSSPSEILIAANDTVYIQKTDTVVNILRDTIKLETPIKKTSTKLIAQSLSNTKTLTKEKEIEEITIDCQQDFCPDDMELIAQARNKNNISNNNDLEEFFPIIEQ